MSGGSTTTTTNQVSATNTSLNNLFTQLFGGNAGGASTAMGYLTNLMSGKGGVDTTALQQINTTAAQTNIQSGAASIKEAFGSSGMASSSDLAKSLGSYYNQAYSTLQQENAQIGLQGQEFNTQAGMQSANAIMNMFSQAANQYYTSQSKQQTSSPWYSNVMSGIMGGLGIVNSLGDISAGGGITGSLSGLWA